MDPEELEEGLLNTSPEDIIPQTGFIADISGNGLLNPADLIQSDFITDISLPNGADTSMGVQAPHPYQVGEDRYQYQVGLDQLGKIIKAGLFGGITKAAFGINPLLGIGLNTPPSFVRAGAKKLGGGDLDLWDKADLAEGYVSGTPLSSFISRFVDIVFPGSTTLDED